MRSFTYLLLGTVLAAAGGCSGLRPKPVYTGHDAVPAEPAVVAEKPSSPDTGRIEAMGSDREGTSNMNRQKMMSEIEDLLGVPYRYGGNTRFGMDCSGFVQTVFKKAMAVSLPRKAEDMFESGHSILKNELNFGDLVFFKDIENAKASHVGIYLDSGSFAHASVSEGIIISNLDESYYSQRYAGARRVVFD